MGAIIGAGLSAVGGVNAAYDESQQQKMVQAEAADNKKLALEAAADAIARGGIEAQRAHTQGAQLQGAQKVAYANSGVDSSVGTAATTQANTAMLTELDAHTAQANAAAEAWGFKVHGMKYAQQAQLEASRSSGRVTGALLGAAGSIAKAGGAAYNSLNE